MFFLKKISRLTKYLKFNKIIMYLYRFCLEQNISLSAQTKYYTYHLSWSENKIYQCCFKSKYHIYLQRLQLNIPPMCKTKYPTYASNKISHLCVKQNPPVLNKISHLCVKKKNIPPMRQIKYPITSNKISHLCLKQNPVAYLSKKLSYNIYTTSPPLSTSANNNSSTCIDGWK